MWMEERSRFGVGVFGTVTWMGDEEVVGMAVEALPVVYVLAGCPQPDSTPSAPTKSVVNKASLMLALRCCRRLASWNSSLRCMLLTPFLVVVRLYDNLRLPSWSEWQVCPGIGVQIYPHKVVLSVGADEVPHRIHGRLAAASPAMDRGGHITPACIDGEEDEFGLLAGLHAKLALALELRPGQSR